MSGSALVYTCCLQLFGPEGPVQQGMLGWCKSCVCWCVATLPLIEYKAVVVQLILSCGTQSAALKWQVPPCLHDCAVSPAACSSCSQPGVHRAALACRALPHVWAAGQTVCKVGQHTHATFTPLTARLSVSPVGWSSQEFSPLEVQQM